jgi:hypothetical protein
LPADWVPAIIWTIRAVGFLFVVSCWLARSRQIRAALRAASPLYRRGEIGVMSSSAILEPGVVGIIRPVLLLPEAIEQHLTPPQLEAVLAHELSHARRRDNLTALLHMAVEALFWFHPLVWWIGARLIEERERACDEEVLRSGSEPKDCARYSQNLRTISGIARGMRGGCDGIKSQETNRDNHEQPNHSKAEHYEEGSLDCGGNLVPRVRRVMHSLLLVLILRGLKLRTTLRHHKNLRAERRGIEVESKLEPIAE